MSLYAQGKPGEQIDCKSCGHLFRQDPPFEVDCPACGAKKGQYCKRPSEHQGPIVPFHSERDLETLRLGFYDHDGNEECGPNSNTDRWKEVLKKHGYLVNT